MDQSTCDERMQRFFEEQPQWLVDDVQFYLGGAGEPLMVLSMPAMQALMAWTRAREREG